VVRRSIVLAIVTGVCLPALAGATAPASAGTPQDEQMKQAILVLRGYIDRTGGYAWWVFPKPAEVRRGGGLDAPLWPRDPWTGGALSSGSGRGQFTYRVASDRRSYELTGYLSWGQYVVRGGMPGTIRIAYNHRTREGAALLQRYIELWALTNGGVYPIGDEIRRHGAVGEQPGMAYWPSNPWTHDPMTQGTRRGHFQYVRADDGSGYTLTMHLEWGRTMVLTDPATLPAAGSSLKGPADETGPTIGLFGSLVAALR
jgi:hypothetical protein